MAASGWIVKQTITQEAQVSSPNNLINKDLNIFFLNLKIKAEFVHNDGVITM